MICNIINLYFLILDDELYMMHDQVYVLKVLAAEAVFYVLVVGLTMGFLHTTTKRTLVVGILCLIFNIAMYAMPLDNMVNYIFYFTSLCIYVYFDD